MNGSALPALNNGTTISGVTDNLSNVTLLPSTTDMPEHNKVHIENQSILYILVPLITVGVIVFLSAMILLFLRKKRLDRLRHRLMPFYNFEPGDEEDWETELLEDDSDSSARKGYKSMDYASSNGHRKLPRLE